MAVDNPMCTGRKQLFRVAIVTMTATDKTPNRHAGGKARLHAVDTVFHDKRGFRVHTQLIRREQKQIGRGFAVGYLLA